jgi:hypothetical protein
MTNKGAQGFLHATDSDPRPGCLPLGSAQSRAAARALLTARKASEEDEICLQTGSILDGKPVNFNGLAETIRAARRREQDAELPASDAGEDSGENHSEVTWEERLAERIRKARERVAREQALDNSR